MPPVAVQIVEILWTKATRGAPRASERVALPRAMPLTAMDAHYQAEYFRIAEWNDFRVDRLASGTAPSLPRLERSLRLQWLDDGQLALGLLPGTREGKPPRAPRPQAIRLAPGEYARLMINGRHVSYSGQFYSEVTYNVAFGGDFHPERFLGATPDREFKLLADLF